MVLNVFNIFYLYINSGKVENRKTLYSNDFIVYTAKKYPGPIESTFLSRTFSDQGIKMRVRKEHRTHQKEHDPKRYKMDIKRKFRLYLANYFIRFKVGPTHVNGNMIFHHHQITRSYLKRYYLLPPMPPITLTSGDGNRQAATLVKISAQIARVLVLQ